MIVVWDERKRISNLAKRGLDFADLDGDFFDQAEVYDVRNGRKMALGWHHDLELAVIYRPLGREAVSVISMRRASRKERRLL